MFRCLKLLLTGIHAAAQPYSVLDWKSASVHPMLEVIHPYPSCNPDAEQHFSNLEKRNKVVTED